MEAEITSVNEYLDTIKDFKRKQNERESHDFLFRGQAADYPLVSKLLRLRPKGDLLKVEQQLLEEFKRANFLLVKEHQAMNDWDYLTLGQHYGLPTRLLDWSNNALTALWFATEQYKMERSWQPYATIWILMATEAHYLNMKENHNPFTVNKTRLFRPRIIKQRINNQSGVFTVQSTESIKKRLSLHQEEDFASRLLKIMITGKCQESVRDELHTLGVNAFSVFPELEGLCSLLQWKFFH